MYSCYFGKQQYNDIKNMCRNFYNMKKYQKQNTMGIADAFQMIWNTMISVMNIGNFIYFIILSKNYDVNTILQKNEYVNSALMSSYYFQAQIFDSFLVIMNMFMMI